MVGCRFFGNLVNEMSANEAMWRRWFEDNEPEQIAIPDYDQRLAEQVGLSAAALGPSSCHL